MNNLQFIKKAAAQVGIFAAILFLISCSNGPKSEDTKADAEEHNEAKFDNNNQEKDAQFLVNAAEINLQEIKLGQLAQQLGRTANIKELGKTMEDEHSKSLNELTTLAKSKTITIPTSTTENATDAYKKLNDKSGSDFDKSYADMMVSGHKDAIAVFEKASTDCNDSDIKAWATQMLSTLRMHLDRALVVQKENEKL
ncbi:MAG: DUF4142 domain-containing protein [Bacteroidia bacterium]|nr:DUF4142 domain-containing protein [Bacteroidia bacterium]